MASLKDLRLRIKSVKNTRQITKTMKMVSAAKVRRARMACESARPYAEKLAAVLSGLAQNTSGGSLLLSGRDDVNVVRVIAFGSDRGLCGSFNSSLIREAHNQVKHYEAQGKKVEVVAVGNKVTQAAKYWPKPENNATYNDIARLDAFELATEIAKQTIADFEAGKCDQVIVVFGKFVNMLTQQPTSLQLIPFATEGDFTGISGGKEYEPEEEIILETLLPRNVTMQVYRSMLETGASEQAARMTAMDNATRNAGDMIKKLSLKYNRGRQAAITTELIEIVAGAEAV